MPKREECQGERERERDMKREGRREKEGENETKYQTMTKNRRTTTTTATKNKGSGGGDTMVDRDLNLSEVLRERVRGIGEGGGEVRLGGGPAAGGLGGEELEGVEDEVRQVAGGEGRRAHRGDKRNHAGLRRCRCEFLKKICDIDR